MRIHGDYPQTRPAIRRGAGDEQGSGSAHLPVPLLSRPKAHPHEVPARIRQSSQADVASFRPANPQWMKTLEEKYRKLHVKIDSYPSSAAREGKLLQNRVNGYYRFNSANKTGYRSLAAIEKPIDIVKLGKSVMRFSKNKRASDFSSRSRGVLCGPTQSSKLNQKINRACNEDKEHTAVLSSGEEVTGHDGNMTADSHDPLYDSKFRVSKSECGKIKPSLSYGLSNVCDKQGQSRGDRDGVLDKPWITNQNESTESYTTDLDHNQYKAELTGEETTNNLPAPPETVTSGYVDTLLQTLNRPFSPAVSCYSHPSTHKSFWRPKSSEAASESASYYLHRERRRVPSGMSRSRIARKKSHTKPINVLLGMSEEARCAISETKKEMDSTFKNGHTEKCNGLPNGILDYSKSEIMECDNVKQIDNRIECTEESGDQEKRETTLSSASLNTNIDEGSNRMTSSLNSANQSGQFGHGPKLPELGQCRKMTAITRTTTTTQGLSHIRVRQHNVLSAGKYGAMRNISREQTFQITPPDYDVRFREILTCDIPDSETPPPDIKAQAVAKCSEWLNRRFIHHPKVIKEKIASDSSVI